MDFTFDKENFQIHEGPTFDAHIGRCILKGLKKNENAIHQIEVTSGADETCGSFRLRSNRLAESLKSRGLKVGDVVLICGMNHNDVGVPYVACQYLGLTPVGLVPGMTKAEVKHLMSISKPNIVFSDPSMLDAIIESLKALDNDSEIIIFGTTDDRRVTEFSNLIRATGTEEDFKCENFDTNETISLSMCSSGTTGLPKIVIVSHRAVYFYLMLPNYDVKSPLFNNSYLHFSPVNWSTAIYTIIGSCVIGYTRLQSAKPYSFEIFKNAVAKYRPSRVMLNPAVVQSLAKNPPQEEFDLSPLKIIASSGTSIAREVFEEFQKLAPQTAIGYGYGSSEAGVISLNFHPTNKKSEGEIQSYIRCKVVDPETREKLGVNQIGEFCLKNFYMFKEYMNDPIATKNAFDEEGYFKTGDLVYLDEDGELHIVDRIKEVIISRNYRIFPVELEDLISTIPGVVQACVVGVPHPIDVERPMALVKLVPGANVSTKTIDDLVSGTLSEYKELTGGIVFVDSLPMTHSSKVDRKAVKALALMIQKK